MGVQPLPACGAALTTRCISGLYVRRDLAVLPQAETDLGVRVLGLANFQSFTCALVEQSVSAGEGGAGDAE